jgi:hypothetical protein
MLLIEETLYVWSIGGMVIARGGLIPQSLQLQAQVNLASFG